MEQTTRRVRAGSTPPNDMPIQYAQGHEDYNPLLDDPGPAWWEIWVGLVVMVVVLAVVFFASWVLA